MQKNNVFFQIVLIAFLTLSICFSTLAQGKLVTYDAPAGVDLNGGCGASDFFRDTR